MGTFLSCNKKVPRLPGRDPARGWKRRKKVGAGDAPKEIPLQDTAIQRRGSTGSPRTVPLTKSGYRMPGNIPFMPRIIFAIPPFENCFIIFCVCSNWFSRRLTS